VQITTIKKIFFVDFIGQIYDNDLVHLRTLEIKIRRYKMLPVLSKECLYKVAPSIFTHGGSQRTSEKYQPISTKILIDKLMNEGFFPTWATQSSTRNKENLAFAKHMIRFQRFDATANAQGLYPELVLVNSHDGLSSYRLMAGLYRVVCGNGLIAGHTYNETRVKHQGDIIGNVIEGTYEVIETARQMLEISEEMSSITLNQEEQSIFAEAAHSLRFDDASTQLQVNPDNLLQTRRTSERDEHDLFTVFNVVQENLMKGGVYGRRTNGNGRSRLAKTRPVKAIDQNVKLNKALWTLAEKMMKLKH
jgi:hypothetical protein